MIGCQDMTDEEFERLCVEQLKSYYKEYDVVEKVLEIFWEKENEAQRIQDSKYLP